MLYRDTRPRIELRYNERQQMSGYTMLRAMEDESAALVFFDPQYRSIMDKQKYGNEGERQKKRAELPQMTDRDIMLFVEQIERVLRPSGHLMFWLDKFTVGSGLHLKFWRFTRDLQIVDLITWNAMRFGMGARTRGTTEFCLVVQKPPVKSKGKWTDGRIRDAWAEAADRMSHPHAKPAQLIERLIRATTKQGDLVVDPCAGSYIVLQACQWCGREFLGCDLV